MNRLKFVICGEWYYAYGSGVAFERDLKTALEEKDYYVMRSAGSHGAADLIAIKEGRVYLIQCKRDFRDLKEEEEKALKLPCIYFYKGRNVEYFWYIIPIHAKKWHGQITFIDLRTKGEVEL